MFDAQYEDDQAPTSIGNVSTVHSNTSTVRSLIGSSSHVAYASGLACVANQRTLYGSGPHDELWEVSVEWGVQNVRVRYVPYSKAATEKLR